MEKAMKTNTNVELLVTTELNDLDLEKVHAGKEGGGGGGFARGWFRGPNGGSGGFSAGGGGGGR
jgi:hypothetical protein